MFRRYRDLLGLPGAAAFAFAGLLSRFPTSMFGIGFLLMVQIQYNSYEMAGRLAAISTLAWAAQTVPTARWTDRVGQSRAMWPLTAIHVAGAVVAIVTAMNRGPEAWLWVAAILASLSGPLGSLTRARWSHILHSDRDIHSAFALEGALDEVLFIGGPALVTVLATTLYPAAGLIICTVAMVIGMAILLSQKATEPPPRGDDAGDGVGWRVPKPVLAVTCIAAAMGLVFGSLDISTVAFAEELGVKGWAGVALAALATGSLIGGLIYGSREWRAPLSTRLVVATSLAAVGFTATIAMPNLWLFAAVGFAAGFTISPIITSTDTAIQRSVLPHQLTEGMAWLRIGIGTGVAGGAWVAGILIERHGARGGLTAAAVAAMLVAVSAIATTPWLRRIPTQGHREGELAGEPVPITPPV